MTAFVPHTLPEQIALITAEAEGRVIYLVAIDGGGAGCLPKNSPGYWDFSKGRYEVEQPLVEEWKVVSRDGCGYGNYKTEADALMRLDYCTRAHDSIAPFRVVHMREVRATQGPTP